MQCIICGKKVKRLKSHLKASHETELARIYQLHPELVSLFNIASSKQIERLIEKHRTEIQAALRVIKSPELTASLESAAAEPPGEAPKSEPTNEFNIAVEQAVLKTLEKMQLGEAINKKMIEIETRLSQQLKATPEPTQQAASQPSAQPTSGDNNDPYASLKGKVLNALAQKFIGGDSGGAGSLAKQLEQLTGLMDFTRKIADTFYSPVQEAEIRAQKRLIGQLELYRKAGASPDKATDLVVHQNK